MDGCGDHPYSGGPVPCPHPGHKQPFSEASRLAAACALEVDAMGTNRERLAAERVSGIQSEEWKLYEALESGRLVVIERDLVERLYRAAYELCLKSGPRTINNTMEALAAAKAAGFGKVP